MQFICFLFNYITTLRIERFLLAFTMLETKMLFSTEAKLYYWNFFRQKKKKCFTLFSLFIHSFVRFVNIQGNILRCVWLPSLGGNIHLVLSLWVTLGSGTQESAASR